MKSWISNLDSGRLRPPGFFWDRRKISIALLCSLAIHLLLLNPVFSQDQSSNIAGSKSGERTRLSLQVSLPSAIAAARPTSQAAEPELAPARESGNAVSVADSNAGGDAIPAAGDRASPSSAALVVPVVPVTTYYRSDELDTRPEITRQIEPEFPKSVNPDIKGVVVARLFIGVDGLVEQVQIVSAQPPGLFEAAVEKSFAGARYTPGMRGGKPVRSQLTLAFDFVSDIAR
ncbi:MAG: energy transducer TonB [Betaproteobacteria bacterium]